MNAHKNWTSQLTFWSKTFLAGGIISFLLSRLDWQAGGELLQQIDPLLLLTAISLHVLAFLCGGLRWWLLLRHIEPQCRYPDIAPAYYLGLFSNNFLPTGFGGDVVRTAYLSMRNYRVASLLSSTLVDRALGLLVLVITGLLTILIQDAFILDRRNILLLCCATLFVFFGVWLLFSPAVLDWLRSRQQFSRYRRFYRMLIDLFKLFHAYRQAPWLLSSGLLLSLVLQILVIGVYILLGYGLGLRLPLIIYFVIIPLVMLATNIPISLGGLGLREGALVALLVAAGVDYEQSVLISLLYLFVLWVATLPGGLVLLKVRLPSSLITANCKKTI